MSALWNEWANTVGIAVLWLILTVTLAKIGADLIEEFRRLEQAREDLAAEDRRSLPPEPDELELDRDGESRLWH